MDEPRPNPPDERAGGVRVGGPGRFAGEGRPSAGGWHHARHHPILRFHLPGSPPLTPRRCLLQSLRTSPPRARTWLGAAWRTPASAATPAENSPQEQARGEQGQGLRWQPVPVDVCIIQCFADLLCRR